MGRKAVPVLERILSRVEKTESGCWLYTGKLNAEGYARVTTVWPERKNAHRIVYESVKGPVPQTLVMDHLCRVRHCLNPDHLEPVTTKENILRGVSHQAMNAVKTHCPQGHPYSHTNAKGYKLCRLCNAERQREHRARKRNQIALSEEFATVATDT